MTDKHINMHVNIFIDSQDDPKYSDDVISLLSGNNLPCIGIKYFDYIISYHMTSKFLEHNMSHKWVTWNK